jgi:hypothetical protein
MGDEVGVEPERLAELASALENLRDVLAHNVPVIANTLEEYWNGGTGTPIDLTPLKQAQARSVQDAADMRARSNLAAAWMANPANIDLVAGGEAYIPWSGSALDQADAALQAQNLNAAVALAKTDPAGARAMLAAIAQDLNDHASDPAYLTAFWSQQGVSASAANLTSLLRTTTSGQTIKSPSKSDYNNVMAVLASAAIPLGFGSKNAYMNFTAKLNSGLTEAGYPGTTPAFQGSSVTGIRFRTGEPVGDDPGDYDIALGGSDLFERAQELGIPLRGGGIRTGPLNPGQLRALGLSDLADELTQDAGRDVHFMIYKDIDDATNRSPSIVASGNVEIEKYYDQQTSLAEQKTQAEEIQAEQAQIQEEEAVAEAEALAEAEAMEMEGDELCTTTTDRLIAISRRSAMPSRHRRAWS